MTDAAPGPAKSSNVGKIVLWTGLLVIVVAAVTFRFMSSRGGPARETAETFIREIDRGDLATAKARCLAGVDFDRMDRYARDMPKWGGIQSISLVTQDKTRPNGPKRYDIGGPVEWGTLKKTFTGTLVEQSDGSYKIESYSFD